MVCIVPIEGVDQAAPAMDSTAVRQAAPEAEAERPEPVPEPESAAINAAAEVEVPEVQIPTWNLGEQIPIAPQIWDADIPQVGEGAARPDSEVEIMTFEEEEKITHVVPEPPRKSPKEKRKKKRRISALQESEGRIVIRLKTTGSAPIAEAVEEEGRPGRTAEILMPTVHSAEEGAVLATEVASVQEERIVEPV
jgi:hypothetical protein